MLSNDIPSAHVTRRRITRLLVVSSPVHSHHIPLRFILIPSQIFKILPRFDVLLLAYFRAGRPTGRSSSPGRVKNFLFSTSSRPALGPTQPPIQWVQGTLSTGVMRPGREADHSPPTSAEVKKTWIYASISP
jgi:hypothetical protein